MSHRKWTQAENDLLISTVKAATDGSKWLDPDKYHRKNVAVWRAIKVNMGSERTYSMIRHRFKNHCDIEIIKNKLQTLDTA